VAVNGPGLVTRLAGAWRSRDLEGFGGVVGQPRVFTAMGADAFEDVVHAIAMAHHVMATDLPTALEADEIGHATHVRERQIDVQALRQVRQRGAAEGWGKLASLGWLRQAERFPGEGWEGPCIEDRMG